MFHVMDALFRVWLAEDMILLVLPSSSMGKKVKHPRPYTTTQLCLTFQASPQALKQ